MDLDLLKVLSKQELINEEFEKFDNHFDISGNDFVGAKYLFESYISTNLLEI